MWGIIVGVVCAIMIFLKYYFRAKNMANVLWACPDCGNIIKKEWHQIILRQCECLRAFVS
jgi:PHP family Zn ribbon phosphoesterase